MRMYALGDLARGFAMQGRNTQIKHQIAKLTAEISSGKTTDVAKHLNGDLTRLADVESRFSKAGAMRSVLAETAGFAEAAQMNLESIAVIAGRLSGSLMTLNGTQSQVALDTIGQQAGQDFSAAIGHLNGRFAGRSLFAGQATDQGALSAPAEILDAARAALAGAADVAEVLARADAWFDDPGGFGAFYTGSEDDLSDLHTPDGTIAFALRADDTSLRAVMRDMAVAALATDPALGLNAAGQSALLARVGDRMRASQEGVIAAQSRVGHAQERIDRAEARNSASMTALDFARGALLSTDPYETATRLEAAQFQLESLYAVTVRTSQLSLVNFLR